MKEKLKAGIARTAAFGTSMYLFAPATFAAPDTSPISVTSVVSKIENQVDSIVLVGGAILAIWVGVKAFKWVRAALS